MTPASTDIADKLAEARKLIRRGWCQRLFNRDECYCATGALSLTTTGQYYADFAKGPLFTSALAALADAAHTESSWGAVSDWNDDPKRKKREVIEAFKRTEQIAHGEAA